MNIKHNSYSETGIRWKLLIIILTVSVIPIIVLGLITGRIIFTHLEKETSLFYQELLEQVATKLDESYVRTAMTMADITLMDNFQNIITAPPFSTRLEERNFIGKVLDENNRTDVEGLHPGGNISRTIMSRLDGAFFVAELDKKSLIYKTDWLLHYFVDGTRNTTIDIDLLKKDPLFLQLREDVRLKQVFGKPAPDVVFTYRSKKRPVMLYPYYFPGEKKFNKLILFLFNSNYFTSLYSNIEKLHHGTLYFLDHNDSILAYNHPGDEDYYNFEQEKMTYIKEDGDTRDIFYNMSFADYQRLNVDTDILTLDRVKGFVKDISQPQPVTINPRKPIIVRHNRIDYLFIAEYAPEAEVQLLYFHPLFSIHTPIYRIIAVILLVIFLMILVIIVVSIILSKSFVTPINIKTKELQVANEQLTHLDALKNDFIANITHDFRSPLTVILNSADISLRLKDIISPSIRNSLEVIYNASLRLKVTVDRLLDLAKMEAGGMKVEFTTVDLVSFLVTVKDFYASALMSHGFKIEGDFTSISDLKIFTDRDKLEEIMNNLVSNAVKFTDIESGMITIAACEKDDNVEIAVIDNGAGITLQNLETIFNRFEQDRDQNSRYKGSGIGLAFSRQLAGVLGGRLWAESEGPGKGAVFYLLLPKGSDLQAENKDDIKLQQQSEKNKRDLLAGLESSMQRGNFLIELNDVNDDGEYLRLKAKIMIIDDNSEIRSIIREYLYSAGYRNFIASGNGREALHACFDYLPDLIISDYNMPGLHGDELQEQLLHNPLFNHVPFLFLSAVTDRDIILDHKERDTACYLQKPIDPQALLVVVKKQLNIYMTFMKSVYTANHDQLTGLANRRSIMDHLGRLISVRDLRDISVLFLDIDNFKLFNDNHGHQTGDKLLAMVGKAIKNSIRDCDVCSRFGGEEFVVLLPDTNIKKAFIVAKKIKKAISNTSLTVDEQVLSVTASFGIASLIDHAGFICSNLEIEGLNQLFIEGNPQGVDWVHIRQLKKGLPSLLLQMSDNSMCQAKKTTCQQCGFQSMVESDFYNDRCSQCGHKNVQHGRNKIVVFDESFMDE